MKKIMTLVFALVGTPALAASKNPFSAGFWHLTNTDLIVSIAFLVFLGVLVYFKVPGMLGGMLAKRADGIKSELEEAKALREEAQAWLVAQENQALRDYAAQLKAPELQVTAASAAKVDRL